MELPGSYVEWRAVAIIVGLVLIYQQHYYKPPSPENEYLIIAVSGGLQHGMPEHCKLHYNFDCSVGGGGESAVRAIYLGRALVRGYKSYLDLMEPTHRQYIDEPLRINSNVFASGCYEHANEYWVYAVDTRQSMGILNNEPRFLSITPDTGLVDVSLEGSGGYTTDVVRELALNEISQQNKSNTDAVAIPLVTAVYFNPQSHVPSPVIDVLEDGTEVTSYPQSMAKWAGVEPLASQLPVVGQLDKCNRGTGEDTCPSNETIGYHATVGPEKEYWDSIRERIKKAEESRPTAEEVEEYGPASWAKCKKRARFGVGPDMARINYIFSAERLKNALGNIGYDIDFETALLVKKAGQGEGAKEKRIHDVLPGY